MRRGRLVRRPELRVHANFEYIEPTTVAEACAVLKEHAGEAKVFAGGAHLTILMKQGLFEPKVLVNIKKIAELKKIQFSTREGLKIGASVTHRELETSSLVKEHFPVIAEAEREVANIRVRNMGTVGGNLASGEPLTDLSQVFIALDGIVTIAGPGGSRSIPVEELFLDFYQTSLAEDEILTEVILPPLPSDSGIDYIRFSSSSVVDKPSAGVAVRIDAGCRSRALRDGSNRARLRRRDAAAGAQSRSDPRWKKANGDAGRRSGRVGLTRSATPSPISAALSSTKERSCARWLNAPR